MTDPTTSQPQFAPQQPPKKGMSGGKKVGLGCGLFVLLALLGGCAAIIGVASSGGNDDSSTPQSAISGDSKESAKEETGKFPGRPDIKKGDKERAINEPVELSGYTTNVTAANFKQSVSSFEDKGYLLVDVSINNRDQKAQSYGPFNWKLITPQGQILDPTFTSAEGALNTADLASGGTVTGKVPFEVGSTKGDYYIVYDPDLASTSRGVWKVTL